MSSFFPAKLEPRVLAAHQLLAKISHVIPPALAEILALASSGLSVAVATVAAVAGQIVVAVAPIAAQTAGALLVRDSNGVQAVQVDPDTIAVIVAILVRRAARNSSPKC
jgi:hypothetical protein